MVSLTSMPRGFTALELLVVLALAALIAVLAVPSFADLRRSAGLSSNANQLLWALHYARSSSILRNVPTVVCLSADGVRCLTSPGVTASAWLVFQDVERSSPPQFGGGDQVLHTQQLPPGFTVSATRSAITFWPSSLTGTTSTFTMCASGDHPDGRAIVVSQTGRPRVAGVARCAA